MAWSRIYEEPSGLDVEHWRWRVGSVKAVKKKQFPSLTVIRGLGNSVLGQVRLAEMNIGKTEGSADRLTVHELCINRELSYIWKVVSVGEPELHYVSELGEL